MTGPHRSDDAPPPKATLYCPECDHASPVDGDWRRDFDDDRIDYECPACETTITSRPRFSKPVPAGNAGSRCCADD